MIVSVSVEWDTSSSAFRHVSKLGVVVHAILGRNGGCRGARAEGSYLLVAFCDWTPDGTVDGSKLDSDSDHHLLFGFHGFNEAQPAKGWPCFLGRWQLERIRVQTDRLINSPETGSRPRSVFGHFALILNGLRI